MTPTPAGYIDEEVVVDGVRAIRRSRISVRKDTGNLAPAKAQWARFPLPWIVALRQTKSACQWRREIPQNRRAEIPHFILI